MAVKLNMNANETINQSRSQECWGFNQCTMGQIIDIKRLVYVRCIDILYWYIDCFLLIKLGCF